MCPFLISKGCEWGRWGRVNGNGEWVNGEGICSMSCDGDKGNQRRSRKKFKDCKGGLSPEDLLITDPNADCTECKMEEKWEMDAAEECIYDETCVRGE